MAPTDSPGPHLPSVDAGAAVEIEGPIGTFKFPDRVDQPAVLFVAGGTGIAPLRAMLHEALGVELPPRVSVLYSARTATEFAFDDELTELARLGRIRYWKTATRETQPTWQGGQGRISRAQLEAFVDGPDTLCFICGPEALVHEVPRMLDELGIPTAQIRVEEWAAPRVHLMTWRPKPAQILALVWVALAAGQTARLVATGSLMSGDGVYHFAHLHSLVVDRDLDPVNEIRYFQEVARSPYTGQPKIGNRPPRNPATGEVVDRYPIGLALLVLPAYLVVYAVAHLLAAAGISADVTGYGWSYQYAASLLVAAYATLGLWCCQRVAASRDVNDADAWRATLLIAAATPWLFYATLEPLFSHALSATAAAVVVWQWLRARAGDRPIPWLMTGLAIGIGVLVRYQDVVLLLVPGARSGGTAAQAAACGDRVRAGGGDGGADRRGAAAGSQRGHVRSPVHDRLLRRRVPLRLGAAPALHALVSERRALPVGADHRRRRDRVDRGRVAGLAACARRSRGRRGAAVSRRQLVFRDAGPHLRQPDARQRDRVLRRRAGCR